MISFLPKLRKQFGISQIELSEKLGISRPTLAALEKGEKDITLEQLKKISEIFDIPFEVFLDEEISAEQKMEFQHSSEKSLKKFHNLLLQCIRYGADNDGKITKTKLAKLVYLCDFAYYYEHLRPLTGFEYKRLPQGPVAIEFFDLIDRDPSLFVENKGQSILVSLLEKPDDSVLTDSEKEIVQKVCKKWKNANTQEIVDFTHRQIPWAVCRDRETIPYALISNHNPEDVY